MAHAGQGWKYYLNIELSFRVCGLILFCTKMQCKVLHVLSAFMWVFCDLLLPSKNMQVGGFVAYIQPIVYFYLV